jgi:phage-related protein
VASISVGSVAVDVVPSVKNFAKDLNGQLVPQGSKLGESIGKAISAGIAKGLGDPLTGPLDESTKKQRPRAPKQGEELGGAFAQGFKKRLQAALSSLPKIKIDADSSEADRRLAELRARMEELAGKTIGVDIDAAKALAELNAIKVELGKVGQNASIDVRADTAAALSQIEAVQAAAGKLYSETPTIQVDADTAKADAELAATDAEVNRLDGRRASIDVDVSGAVSSLGRLAAQAATLGPLLIGVGAAGAAGMAALAAPAAAAAAGFGGLALVAVPAITRIKTALDAQTKAQAASAAGAAQEQSRALAQAAAQQQLAAAIRNAAVAHQQAVDQVRSAEQQYTAALQTEQNAQRELAQARLEARRALEDMKNQVIDAGLAVQQSQLDIEQARLSLDQLRASARAAAQNVAQAQTTLTQAQAAQRALAGDPNATDAAKQQAAANVQAAQAALKAAQDQKKARDLEIRQAQLAYEQQVQRLKEQQLQLKRLQQDERAAAKAGVDGSNAVLAARQRLAAANLAIVNSERQLAEARANVARVDQSSADQVASAQRSVTQAALQGASANATLTQSLAALSPAARSLMVAWQGFSKVFTAWQASLEPTVLPVLARGLGVLQGIFPLLTPVVRGAASALDELLTAAQRTLASPLWQSFAGTLGQLVHGAISTFGQAALNIATGVVGIIQAFAPFAPIVLGIVAQIGTAFAQLGQRMGGFQPIIGQLVSGFARIIGALGPALGVLLGAVGRIAGPLVGVVAQLAEALGPLIISAVQGLEPVLLGLAPILGVVIRSLQPVVAALITGLRPVLAALVPVIGVVVGALGRVLVALAPILPVLGNFITALINGLLPVLTPMITLISQMAAQFAGALIGALRASLPSIQQIVLAVAGLLPAITPLLTVMPQLEMAFIPLIPPIAQLVALIVTALVPILRVLITIFVRIVTTVAGLLLPVVRFLVSAITIAVNVIRVVLSAIGVALRAVGAAAVWLWQNAIQPAFNFISIAARILAAVVLFAVIAPIIVAFRLFQAAALFLWQNVIVPAFNGIRAAISLAWTAFIRPTFNGMKVAVNALGAVFRWLWHNVISPVWGGIKLVIATQWAAIKVVFNAVVGFLRNTLGPVFRWLWHNVVTPIWNGIKTNISAVWNTGIKPVFNALKDGIKKVGDAFTSGARVMKSAWDKIKSYAQTPVRFVIDKVINHGLLWAWDTLAKWLHLPANIQIPYLKLPFANGGIVQYYANGGMENHQAQIAPAGAMRVWAEPETGGEAYIPLASNKRGRSTAILGAVADHFGYGLVPFADGGFWGNIGKIASGLLGKGIKLGKAALDAVTDPAKWIVSHLTSPVKSLLGKIDSTNFGKASVAVGEKTLGWMGDALKKLLNLFSGGSGAQAMVNLALTQVGTHEGPGNSQKYSHELGRPSEAWCFAAGTLVDTPTGLVPIEELEPGALVLTPSGAIAETSRLLTREKELLRLVALGVPDTLVTEDHPYWAMRRTTPAKHKRRLSEPEWIPAGELKRGDMIALPIPADGDEPFDPALAYVLGMYLADGHRLHRESALGVQFSDDACERERIVTALKDAGFEDVRVTENRTCLHFTVYDARLYELCGQFGDLAHGKQVPGEVFGWDREARQALIDGYLAGDGSYSDEFGYRATTVSRRLAIGLGKLVRSLGFVPNIRVDRDAGQMTIEGRTVRTRRQYGLEWKPRRIDRPQFFEQDGYLWVPVRSVDSTGGVETVYDLTVPGEHAFVADGAAVHNCADFVDWLAMKTGQSAAIPQTASAPGMASGFGSRFQSGSSGIQAGDIVFFSEGQGSIVHTGIAVSPNVGGSWTSVEGNYGDQVVKQTRSSAAGFAHPAYTGGAVGSFPGGSLVHASPSAAQAWAQQALVGYGWQSQSGDLIRLWNRESGWRWNATNPYSGAYGIPQSLPASKMGSAGGDWRDNAATQIKWGLGYIRGRYGSPAAAWAHETSAGWYDQGGWLPTGPSLVYNGTGQPEAVFTGSQFEDLVNGRSGGGATEYHAHFDGWTAGALEGRVRTAFHTMEVQNASTERVGRRR